MKRFICVLLTVALVAVSVFATGSQEAAADVKIDVSKDLKVGITSDFADLDPFGAGTVGKNIVYYTIYEYLCNTDANGKLYGVIAKDWKTIDDGMTWDINIYDYVYDTNGNHITADDVVFSYLRYKSNGKGMARFIGNCEKTGDYSVRITLSSKEYSGFEQMIRATAIVSQKEYEASPDHFSTSPVGTTQYRVAEFVSGSSLTLEKTEKYWQTDELRQPFAVANAEKITFMVIKEASQMAIALENGTIDIADGISITEVEQMEKTNNYRFFTRLNSTGYQILFSGKDSPFADNQKLRQAVAYSINKQGLIDALLGGRGVAEFTTGFSGWADADPSWGEDGYYDYNPELAKTLLAEAGYPEGAGLEIDIMVANAGYQPRMAQVIQGYLLAVGIKSNILVYDSALFSSNSNLPETYDLMINPRGGYDLITAWTNSLRDTNAQYKGFTSNGFVDPILQEMLAKTGTTQGHTSQNMTELNDYLEQMCYTVGMFDENIYDAVSAKSNIVGIVNDTKTGNIYAPGTLFD